MGRSGRSNGLGELGIELDTPPGELGDATKRVGVGLTEVGRVDVVGPGLEGCGPF